MSLVLLHSIISARTGTWQVHRYIGKEWILATGVARHAAKASKSMQPGARASTEEIPTQFFYLVVCVNEPLYYLGQGLHDSCYV